MKEQNKNYKGNSRYIDHAFLESLYRKYKDRHRRHRETKIQKSPIAPDMKTFLPIFPSQAQMCKVCKKTEIKYCAKKNGKKKLK